MRRQLALPAAILLAIATGDLTAQQQPPTFRSKTELIIVDAIVVDKDGNAVRGLKASDFALSDRKKPQVIETFEEVSHERPTGATAEAAMPLTLKLDVASNMTLQADRLVLVLIDDLRIWQGRTEKAKALARDIVTKLGNQASMAVLFTSREGGTEVTQDRSELLAAIDGMKARQTFRRPHQGKGAESLKLPPVDPTAPAAVTLDRINTVAQASLQDYFDNSQSQATVEGAARMLFQEDRRRKAFVLISEGVDAYLSQAGAGTSNPTQIIGPESATRSGVDGSTPLTSDSSAEAGLFGMFAALRAANVALYAIDPRGKVRAEDMMLESWPPLDCAVCSSPPAELASAERAKNREDSQFAWENPVRRAQSYLGAMSARAGGFAVTDTDDLTGGLSRILEDLDHYYLLGFYPTVTSSGNATHPVELSVPGHPDYTMRFRRGYTLGAPSPPLKSKDPLAELATGVMPKSDLPLRLTAMPLPGTGKAVSVAVALEVTAPVGLMKEADKKLRDDITYSVMVVDSKKAKVTQRTGRSATFSMSATDPTRPEPDQVKYQIPLTIDLAPGRYQLRASAMSKKLAKGGSVYLDLTVPDYSKMRLVLTSIAIGFADGPRVPVGRTTAPTAPIFVGGAVQTRGAPLPQTVPTVPNLPPSSIPPAQQRAQNSRNPLPFEPTLSREFDRSDALHTYFEVARSDKTTTVALEIRVLDSNNEPQLKYDRIVSPRDPGGIGLRIPLQTLSPGAYTLRIEAGDGLNRAKTETGFIVK
jgi:VWFA-related protein